MSLSNIDQVFHRIFEVSTTFSSTLLSTIDVGTYSSNIKYEDLKYVRITNLGNVNKVRLTIAGSNEEYVVELPPNASFMLADGYMDATEDTSATTTMNPIGSISGIALVGNTEVEVFAAGITS
jgi:hypothetical protein